MADYTDLDPTLLRASVSDGTNLKPSITTSSYAGGTPAAAADLKASICYADGTLKESIADSVGVKASWLIAGSARPPTVAGLTEVATATVSGGAVSSLSITVNLEAGKSYRFGCGKIMGTVASDSRIDINNDLTDANYDQGFFTSSGTSNDNNARLVLNPTAAGGGDVCVVFGLAGLLNSTPHHSTLRIRQNPVGRGGFFSGMNTSETSFSTIRLYNATGSYIDNGTWLTCWRLD